MQGTNLPIMQVGLLPLVIIRHPFFGAIANIFGFGTCLVRMSNDSATYKRNYKDPCAVARHSAHPGVER
jgi:hypothetical protein